jgi:hypothetical protein
LPEAFGHSRPGVLPDTVFWLKIPVFWKIEFTLFADKKSLCITTVFGLIGYGLLPIKTLGFAIPAVVTAKINRSIIILYL